jgi:hypothetical protein
MACGTEVCTEAVAACDDIIVASRREIARHFLALSNMVCFKYVQRIKLNGLPESRFAILATFVYRGQRAWSSRSPAHADWEGAASLQRTLI